jgi:hypothetical protein
LRPASVDYTEEWGKKPMFGRRRSGLGMPPEFCKDNTVWWIKVSLRNLLAFMITIILSGRILVMHAYGILCKF